MTGFGAMTTLPRAIVTPGDVCKPCPGDVVLSQSPSTTICCAIYFLQSCIQAWNWNLYHYQTTYSSFTTSKTLAGHVKVTPAYLLNSSHLPTSPFTETFTHAPKASQRSAHRMRITKVLEPAILVRLQRSFSSLLQKVWSGFGVGPKRMAWDGHSTGKSLGQKERMGVNRCHTCL